MLESAFNQEKALVGAFSMIIKLQIICCLSPWLGTSHLRAAVGGGGTAAGHLARTAEEVMGYTAHNLTQGDIINLGASGGCRIELSTWHFLKIFAPTPLGPYTCTFSELIGVYKDLC